MVSELTGADLDRVLPLVPAPAEAGHMTFARTVLDGSMPGFVLADDPHSPRSAFVCNLGGFWLALGEASPAFAAAALPELVARCPQGTGTSLWAPARQWEAVLGRHLMKKGWRTEFHFEGRPELPPARPPDGFQLVSIDAAVAAGFGQGLDPWVVDIWGGPDGFATRSFGVALVEGRRPVSFAAACAIQQRGEPREVEVEIGTEPAFREQGLAAIVGSAFVDECLGRHLLPAWTCGSDNVPSERLALRLGFRVARRIAGFALHAGMRKAGETWI